MSRELPPPQDTRGEGCPRKEETEVGKHRREVSERFREDQVEDRDPVTEDKRASSFFRRTVEIDPQVTDPTDPESCE